LSYAFDIQRRRIKFLFSWKFGVTQSQTAVV